MKIVEYRITLPVSVKEYNIAQLYMVAKRTLQETKSATAGQGIEILKNEPFENENGKGQYTHKVFHIDHKVPGWLKAILPKSAMIFEEKAWNGFPYCKTVYSSPFLEKFHLSVESMHIDDRGETENALKCDKKTLKKRIVDKVDIGNEPINPEKEDENVRVFKSKKTGRGPFVDEWQKQADPVMTCYKLVKAEFKYWGLQGKVEKLMQTMGTRDILLSTHRQLICWMDEWHGMTMEDIRKLEAETQKKVNSIIQGEKGDSETIDNQEKKDEKEKEDDNDDDDKNTIHIDQNDEKEKEEEKEK
ncbi:phosphatidylinositol transfer protein [Anaeramoeba ignava]|uniref:Phosphatidylinositol transfer protein n=1 Tax=Anaeramoeba ignava TaxID=1746090 RepID=A0A9Q0R6Q9_ANAIG|nr:phosphatidylinositol transfer protein [Anaeramoeba ignava]